MRTAQGYAALERHGAVMPWTFERRDLRPTDVALDIHFCGICHSDLHAIESWGQEFPLVPGHELVGVVSAVGGAVTQFRAGDRVAVGTIVDSCRECPPCLDRQESYCLAYPTTTYDGIDRVDGSRTRNGYSDWYVADERFVHALPDGLDLAGTAPLLCAGITTYSPLRHWRVGSGSVVGVLGIGGLGHLGLKFARAMGAHVVALTTSPGKREAALALGAHEVVVTSGEGALDAQANRFDFILDTVSTGYPMNPYVRALRLNGTLCTLGLRGGIDVEPVTLAIGRRSVASSGAGGTCETAEMLAFCAEHGIAADVELVRPEGINEALRRLEANDIRYRFVIDLRPG